MQENNNCFENRIRVKELSDLVPKNICQGVESTVPAIPDIPGMVQ